MRDTTAGDRPSGEDPGTAAARERLETVLAGFNRLSPDELARIGLSRPDPAARAALLDAARRAANRAGRSALRAAARRRARDMILRRYQQGAFHPTFVTLNWGLSQGTTKDRVAIVEALQDAATSAVVADLVEPDVADALAADGAAILGLSSGMAYEGALDRAIAPPRAGYRDQPIRRWAVIFLAIDFIVLGVAALALGGERLDALIALAVGAVFALAVVLRARGTRDPGPPVDTA